MENIDNQYTLWYTKSKHKRRNTMPRSPEAIKRAKAKYNKKVKKIAIEFYPQDAELLQKLNEQPNKQAYLKDLIRKDIR